MKLDPSHARDKERNVTLTTLRLAAAAAIVPTLLAYVDTPWRTFRQRVVAHRWAERMVLLSIELNLLLLWLVAKLLVNRDAGLAPESWSWGLACAGFLLAWAGAALTIWAKLSLGRWFSASFAVKQGHELITHGPYAIVRHPIYVGLLLLGVGLGITWDSLLTTLFAALYAVPFWLHTVFEEQMLATHFGDAWTSYTRRVPRFVPSWRVRR